MNKRRSRTITNYTKRGALSRIFVISFILVIIVFASFYINYRKVSAENSSNRTKQVVSIKIEAGDTLWNIAKEYMTEEYRDINEYIEEIKTSNGLFEDIIHEGHYIIIPHYANIDYVNNLDIVYLKTGIDN